MIVSEIMTFSTYNDFFKRRYIIKNAFNKLDSTHKKIYRLYIFADRSLSTMLVEMMWEFLSEPDDSKDRPSDELMERYCISEPERGNANWEEESYEY